MFRCTACALPHLPPAGACAVCGAPTVDDAPPPPAPGHYGVLGIAVDATTEQIAAAIRGRRPGTAADRELARDAAAVLGHPATRDAYDQLLAEGEIPDPAADPRAAVLTALARAHRRVPVRQRASFDAVFAELLTDAAARSVTAECLVAADGAPGTAVAVARAATAALTAAFADRAPQLAAADVSGAWTPSLLRRARPGHRLALCVRRAQRHLARAGGVPAGVTGWSYHRNPGRAIFGRWRPADVLPATVGLWALALAWWLGLRIGHDAAGVAGCLAGLALLSLPVLGDPPVTGPPGARRR